MPPKPDNAPAFTLVLDLDETLIHYVESDAVPFDTLTIEQLEADECEHIEFFIRPGVYQFLAELSQHYELVLYTAATRDYADYFLRRIDPKNLFGENVLTREHVKFDGYFAIKDLRLLGRDLRSTIIIDNLKENFESTTPDNGIEIENFEGSFDD